MAKALSKSPRLTGEESHQFAFAEHINNSSLACVLLTDCRFNQTHNSTSLVLLNLNSSSLNSSSRREGKMGFLPFPSSSPY